MTGRDERRPSSRSLRDRVPLRLRKAVPWHRQGSTWREAKPAVIAQALKRATALPSGNWYAVAASREISGRKPFGANVAGTEVVVWRDQSGRLRAGPRQLLIWALRSGTAPWCAGLWCATGTGSRWRAGRSPAGSPTPYMTTVCWSGYVWTR